MSNPQIKVLSDKSSKRIIVGQAIAGLESAVKELIENSIDSGATSINIKLTNYGIDSIQVSDNGSGIQELDHASVALQYHTSKISEFEDIYSISSLGFRGLALSALAGMGNLEIKTSTGIPDSLSYKLSFDFNGNLIHSTKTHGEKGTIVSLSKFFSRFPVRQAEFRRNIKREYSKCISIVQRYAIIFDHIRFSVINETLNSNPTRVLSSSGSGSVINSLGEILGPVTAKKVTEFEFNIDLIDDKCAKASGLISKVDINCLKSNTEYQYFYINKRVTKLQKVAKIINDLYLEIIPNKYPIVVFNLNMPPQTFDINVTPDKKTVILEHEDKILEELKKHLSQLLLDLQSSLEVLNLIPPENAKFSNESIFNFMSPLLEESSGKLKRKAPELDLKDKTHHVILEQTKSICTKKSCVDDFAVDQSYLEKKMQDCISSFKNRLDAKIETELNGIKTGIIIKARNIQENPKVKLHPVDADQDANGLKLSTIIKKSDFEKMDIIGQFNLGFIVTRLGKELFVVDQHASDEKHTYETLKKDINIDLQMLLKPVELHLSAKQKLTILENLETLGQMGFKFHIENGEQNISLLTVPRYKGFGFGLLDLEETLDLIDKRSSEILCSKMRSMLASRACRTSIMIGQHLTNAQMRNIIVQMGTMDSPWVSEKFTFTNDLRIVPTEDQR